MTQWEIMNQRKTNQNPAGQTPSPVAPCLMSKGLDHFALPDLPLVTQFSLLGWFHSLNTALRKDVHGSGSSKTWGSPTQHSSTSTASNNCLYVRTSLSHTGWPHWPFKLWRKIPVSCHLSFMTLKAVPQRWHCQTWHWFGIANLSLKMQKLSLSFLGAENCLCIFLSQLVPSLQFNADQALTSLSPSSQAGALSLPGAFFLFKSMFCISFYSVAFSL